MSQDIPNHFEGYIDAEHSGSKRVTEEVEPPGTRTLIELRPLKGPDHHCGEIVCGSERLEGGLVADKDVPCPCRGTSRMEVINEGLRHLGQEGQTKVLTRFGLAESDMIITPMDVIKTKIPDVARPHAVSCPNEDHGIVPSAQCMRAVCTGKELDEFRLGEHIVKTGVTIPLCPTYHGREILFHSFPHKYIMQKAPDDTDIGRPSNGRSVPAAHAEIVDTIGPEASESMNASLLDKLRKFTKHKDVLSQVFYPRCSSINLI